MGARTKINTAALNGCVIVAAVFGLAFDSLGVFITVTVLLIAGDCYSGLIRPGGSIRRSR